MEINELIKFWIDSSDDDFQAMTHLFEKKDYTWSLFIGHLVLEKLLKAWYMKNNFNTPPFIHDLVRLAEKGNLTLDESQKDILDTISTFNIRGRYDDYKREFYKKCSPAFTKEWVHNIKEFRKWIKTKLLK
ncbi:MAG: HEPN domain-containing protein [Proteobacteria bacterium]|nr:HEPN domain-containing protein [Pseudomonadota bacterium]MBU1386354.1 HEPN domain-containing protein [Pseudomonadota bacterium]MBU1541360.1 HEPN domain-containing protein [Pseudomonadota bacterium]MBU2431966.1 HEPN domain-containing protein [Pseudomonadota bacterium]MBU2482515.1 HEPN domain-containing protein [Pseudomonadota bacterium]